MSDVLLGFKLWSRIKFLVQYVGFGWLGEGIILNKFRKHFEK